MTTPPDVPSRATGDLFPADVLLSDGTIAVIRPPRPEDAAELRDMGGVTDGDLDSVLASFDVLALIAVYRGRAIGIATAEPNGTFAKVAFLVAEGRQGLGVGSLLLEHLAAIARERDVRRFVAEVPSENQLMLKVFGDAGFSLVEEVESGAIRVEMETASSPVALRAADDREFVAEVESLRPLLHPGSVAVYGARRDGSGIGAAVLRSVLTDGFQGTVHAVHPSAEMLEGVTAVPSLAEVESPVDLVVIAVPAARVLDALSDAASSGVRAAVVVSSGFGELGAEGARLQREMLEFARSHDLRVVGPNCLGVIINDSGISLNATFGPPAPPRGGLAVASQSGGVGIVLSDLARQLDLGVRAFISLGNKCDVSSNDLLAAWMNDPEVTAAALYLESFGNAPKFARFARRFAEHKPLLAVVGGRSSSGQRAGASHTAAAATPSVGIDALFAQAGVIGCSSAEDLAETALLLTEQPMPAGTRLAVLSNAGGMGVLAADAADSALLSVPELSDELRSRIAPHVLGTTGTTNPIDAGAAATWQQLAAITDELLGSDEIDTLIVVLVATNVGDAVTAARAVASARANHPDKPVVLVPMGGLDLAADDVPGITRFGTISSAVQALSRAAEYAGWRAEQRDAAAPLDVARAASTRRIAAELLADEAQSNGWLDAPGVVQLLTPYALAPAGEVTIGHDAALAAARRVGYPVAVKVAIGSVVHKTERGLVRVGVPDEAALRRALDSFTNELGSPDVPVLVQPMVTGAEVALGVTRDPAFGPLVMVGAGGVTTDLWADRVFLVPPVTPRDASRALRSLRTWPLLSGFRGAPPMDVTGLVETTVRLGQLVEEVPEVAELDLNPVLVTPTGSFLVDVKVRLDPAGSIDAGVPRRLRAWPGRSAPPA